MPLISICITFGIRLLTWIPVNGRARILASANWPVNTDSGSMRTSTQGPRTTDHGAGRVDSVIILLINPNEAEMCLKEGKKPTPKVSNWYRRSVGEVSKTGFLRIFTLKSEMPTPIRHLFDTYSTP